MLQTFTSLNISSLGQVKEIRERQRKGIIFFSFAQCRPGWCDPRLEKNWRGTLSGGAWKRLRSWNSGNG
jgi:hypothetical protein